MWARVATMINADMQPQEITKCLDEHVDQAFSRKKIK